MAIKCPRCKDHLYLIVTDTHTYAIDHISFTDVIPGDKVDDGREGVLSCLACNWKGWLPQYHQAADGVTPLASQLAASQQGRRTYTGPAEFHGVTQLFPDKENEDEGNPSDD